MIGTLLFMICNTFCETVWTTVVHMVDFFVVVGFKHLIFDVVYFWWSENLFWEWWVMLM